MINDKGKNKSSGKRVYNSKIFGSKNPIRPDSYRWVAGIECIDVIKQFPFIPGNIIKYIWRAYSPERINTERQLVDLEKAADYIAREIKSCEIRIRFENADADKYNEIDDDIEEIDDAE